MERIPILRMGNCLLVTIQVDMHDRLVTALQDDLTTKIADSGARGVLIDLSALERGDSGSSTPRQSSWGCSRPSPSRSWNWGSLWMGFAPPSTSRKE